MTPILHNATRPFILTLAVGLITTVLVVLACGPSAPAGQDNATPEPTDTPTPTSEPSSDQNQAPLDGILNAWVAGAEAQRETGGATGQSEPERTIAILLFVGNAKHRTAIIELLEDNDIAHHRVEGPLNHNDIRATVPVSMLSRLAAHPGVQEIFAKPHPYRNMTTHLNVLAAKYEAGLLPDEDANPTYARLVIGIEGGDDNYYAVKRYLENNGATMVFAERDMEEIYKPDIVAFTPISLLVPLAGMTGVVDVWDEGYPVPESLRFRRSSIFEEPAETPTPTPTATSSPPSKPGTPADGAAGSAVSSPPTPTPAPAGAIAHGADHWNADGIRGQGIKIGIIDVAYGEYKTLVDQGELANPAGGLCHGLPSLAGDRTCLFLPLTEHGAAVAEAIRDIAPEASLYLTAPLYDTEFQSAVRWLRNQDVDVIVQARGWQYDRPGDGTYDSRNPDIISNRISRQVYEAMNDHIIWVNSAGNETERTWFATST